MRKILYLAATVLLCASCFHVNSNFKGVHFGGKGTVKGEGPVLTKSFDLKDFDSITINGQASILFTQAATFEVTLRTQENIFDVVDYRVEGSTLVIETQGKKTVQAEAYDLTIQAPDLKRLEVNGATDFEIPDELMSEGDVKIEVNGAADLNLSRISCATLGIQCNGAADVKALDIDVAKVDIQVNGAGDIRLSGNAGTASLDVNGAGDVDARDLAVAGEIKKHVAGLADIKLP